jgi:hypothetical protein
LLIIMDTPLTDAGGSQEAVAAARCWPIISLFIVALFPFAAPIPPVAAGRCWLYDPGSVGQGLDGGTDAREDAIWKLDNLMVASWPKLA